MEDGIRTGDRWFHIEYKNPQKLIFTNLPQSLLTEILSINKDLGSTQYDGRKLRYRVVQSGQFIFAVCSAKPDHIKSAKAFRAYSDALLVGIDGIADLLLEARASEQRRTKRLVHNLTTINAHAIQEFSENFEDFSRDLQFHQQQSILEEAIRTDITSTAKFIFGQRKNDRAIKTELSVFNQIYDLHPRVQLRAHHLHPVLMNVLYVFFSDFTDQKIRLKVAPIHVDVLIDYDSFHVALWHFIENTAKYALPNQDIEIVIDESRTEIRLMFKMLSCVIQEDERSKIFQEGYRGRCIPVEKSQGQGIGLYLVEQALSLNSSRLEISSSEEEPIDLNGCLYRRNVFVFVIPRA